MIREAVKEDRDQLYDLYKMLVPNSKKMNVEEEQIERMNNDPMNFLFIYEEHGNILGTITLNICLQALHGFSPYSIVENIVVHEEHRSKGIGEKLLLYVEDYCRTLDCHKIMLLCSSKRTRAHQFYERLGYDGNVSRAFKNYL